MHIMPAYHFIIALDSMRLACSTSSAHIVSFCDADSAHDATVPVYNLDNQEVGHYTLPHGIFGVDVRRDILHRVVRWLLAKRQQV